MISLRRFLSILPGFAALPALAGRNVTKAKTGAISVAKFRDEPNAAIASLCETVEMILNILAPREGQWSLKWSNELSEENPDRAHGQLRLTLVRDDGRVTVDT